MDVLTLKTTQLQFGVPQRCVTAAIA